MNDPMLQAKVLEWRAAAQAGTLTLEDMKEAVKAIRAGRMGAAAASDSSRRKKAAKVVKSADELLNELEGLG